MRKRVDRSSLLTSNEPRHRSEVEKHVDKGDEEDDGGKNCRREMRRAVERKVSIGFSVSSREREKVELTSNSEVALEGLRPEKNSSSSSPGEEERKRRRR